MNTKKYDVIIIGAGISGLTAGTFLSKNGLKVLLVEKNTVVGGCYSSFWRRGFLFDAAGQIIGSCNKSDVLGSILYKLGVDVDFIRLKITDIIHFPDEMIKIDGEYKKFKLYLKERYPQESASIDKFFDFLVSIKNKSLILCVMKKYASWTYQSFLNSFFQDENLKSIFSAQAGYLGLPPDKVSAVSAIFLLKTYQIDGAFYPRGGSRVLSDKLAEAFKKSGGTLILNKEVGKILTENNRVSGIQLAGEKIDAKVVVSSSDIERTYKKLLDLPDSTKNNDFYGKLENYKIGSSCCIMYLGVSKKMNLVDKQGWYYPSRDVNHDFEKLINIHIPTNLDESLSKSADHMAIVTLPFDYKNDIRNDRSKFKSTLSKQILDRVETCVPGIGGNVLISEVATPLTIERYTFNSGGSLYGWAQLPNQTHQNCFPIKSPVKGLFHAGHWTLPGGGVVAVAASGANVAKKILQKIQMQKKKRLRSL
jgi:phytoene dehydrogenase-like protein